MNRPHELLPNHLLPYHFVYFPFSGWLDGCMIMVHNVLPHSHTMKQCAVNLEWESSFTTFSRISCYNGSYVSGTFLVILFLLDALLFFVPFRKVAPFPSRNVCRNLLRTIVLYSPHILFVLDELKGTSFSIYCKSRLFRYYHFSFLYLYFLLFLNVCFSLLC